LSLTPLERTPQAKENAKHNKLSQFGLIPSACSFEILLFVTRKASMYIEADTREARGHSKWYVFFFFFTFMLSLSSFPLHSSWLGDVYHINSSKLAVCHTFLLPIHCEYSDSYILVALLLLLQIGAKLKQTVDRNVGFLEEASREY
jgi:hypothetical protein